MLKSLCNETPSHDQLKEIQENNGISYVCYYSYESFDTVRSDFSLPYPQDLGKESRGETKLENFDTYDFISMNIPHSVNAKASSAHVYIFLKDNLLLFVCPKHQLVDEILLEIASGKLREEPVERILYSFFDSLTIENSRALGQMEQEIADIEEQLMTEKKSDYLKELFALRKKARILKHYYEQLLDITEGMEENENQFLHAQYLRLFKILSNRITRLYNSVLNLNEYVTQMREAYQSQVDINLNRTMKFFTVITSIFLPLTLIAGWYGMNLKMPEFRWSFSYPLVIVVSVLIVIGEIVFFKKNKWF